jgi:Tfp pilus assembly protein PilF
VVAHVWTLRDWRPLLTLSLIIVLGFSFIRLVVTLYKDKEDALATEYYQSGLRQLAVQRPAEAVDALETALVYSRDNFQYRLKLTDALLANGNSGEARAQLRAFWEQHPGDAQVNLKLARLEARQKHPEDAIRYYENAIEGVWPDRTDPAPQRIETRFDESEYLVELRRPEQAEAALLALKTVLPENSPEQGRLGDLFLRNGDATEALNAYENGLRSEKHELHPQAEPALDARQRAEREEELRLWSALSIGAARASFELGNFSAARHYLEELSPKSAEAEAMLQKLDRMEALDPFADKISPRQRHERLIADYRIAIERLARCGLPFAVALSKNQEPASQPPEPAPWGQLASWAARLNPMMSERKLRGRDDVEESALRFVFQSEAAAQASCGPAGVDDEALALLSRKRLGAAQ